MLNKMVAETAASTPQAVTLSASKGRTPEGDANPQDGNPERAAISYCVSNCLLWLAYMVALSLLKSNLQGSWVTLTEPLAGTVGAMIPMGKALAQRLPTLGQEDRLPYFLHLWGMFWLFQSAVLIFQCKQQLAKLVRRRIWIHHEWGYAPGWLAILFVAAVCAAALLGGGGLLEPSLKGQRSINFVITNGSSTIVLLYFLTAMVMNFGVFAILAVTTSKLIILFGGNRTRWVGYGHKPSKGCP